MSYQPPAMRGSHRRPFLTGFGVVAVSVGCAALSAPGLALASPNPDTGTTSNSRASASVPAASTPPVAHAHASSASPAAPSPVAPNLTSTPTETTTANLAVNSAIALTGLTTSFTLTGLPGETAEADDAVSMNVLSNDPTGYTVQTEATADNMTSTVRTTGSNLTIPAIGAGPTAPGLEFRDGTGQTGTHVGTFTPVTLAYQTTDTATGLSATGGDTVSTDWEYANIPVTNTDTYAVTLNYIAVNSLI